MQKNIIKLYQLIITVVLLLGNNHAVFAKESPIKVASIVNTTLAVNDSARITDISPSDYMSDTNNIVRIYNKLQLSVNKEMCLPDSFEVRIGFRIRWWGKDMIYKGLKDTILTAIYNKRTGALNIEKSAWVFEGALEFSAVVTSITQNFTTSGRNFIKIELSRSIRWYPNMDDNDKLNGQVALGQTTSINWVSAAHDQFILTFDNKEWAEEHELQWYFVDMFGTTGANSSVNPANPDFKNNATSVLLPSIGSTTTYTFNNTFERGRIFFRVRPIARHRAWPDHRVLGAWSNIIYHDIDNHENLKNWQYVSVFAEERKYKEAISYMDGTMRNRQSVSRNNSDNQAIVGESIYDNEGRVAITMMPVPAFSDRLGYFTSFNLNASAKPYNEADFDVYSTADCNLKKPDPVSNESGAGRYYSSANNYNTGYLSNKHSYIPDAHGYPFVQVEYMHDNTGRILRQGGPGPNHVLGSGHETKYNYTTPDQTELIRLFGTNTGDYAHYKKTSVTDANGQVSISYQNAKGQVVATALAGSNPDNVSQLSSLQAAQENEIDLLSSQTTNYSNEVTGITRENVLTRFIQVDDANSVHRFYYKMPIPQLSDFCFHEEKCMFGVYDLEITLSQEGCGQTIFNITRTLGLDGTFIDTLCSHGPKTYTFQSDNTAFPVVLTLGTDGWLSCTLQKGTYTLTKKLKVNSEAIKNYTDFYLNRATCLKTKDDFDAEYLSKIDTSECHPNCIACNKALGTWQDFLNAALADRVASDFTVDQATLYAKLEYDHQLRECEKLCDTVQTACEEYLEMMKMDVSPTGQYFQTYWDKTNDPNGILRPKKTDDANNPIICLGGKSVFSNSYYGLAGEPVIVDGEIKTVADLTEEEFIQYFEPHWADILVKHHREYCRYEQCLALNDTGETWMTNFLTTTSCSEAKQKGYFNPLNITHSTFTTSKPDPLFVANSTLRTNMVNKLNAVIVDDYVLNNNYTVDLNWDQYIYMGTVTDPHDNDLVNLLASRLSSNAPCDYCTEEVYNRFKGLYMKIRQEVVSDFLRNCTCSIPDGYRVVFPSVEQMKSGIMTTLNPTNKAESEYPAHTKSEMTKEAQQSCEDAAWGWMEKLRGCFLPQEFNPNDQLYLDLQAKLVAVCKGGADERNQFGSSTVSPDYANDYPTLPHSFKEAIIKWDDYNVANGKYTNGSTVKRYQLGVCDELLIDFPEPYNHNYYASNSASPSVLDIPQETGGAGRSFDECTCKKLDSLGSVYNNTAIDICRTNGFAAWVNSVYGTSFSTQQIDVIIALCHPSRMGDKPGHGSCDDYEDEDAGDVNPPKAVKPKVTTPPKSMEPTAEQLSILAGIKIPPTLRCEQPCLTCNEVLTQAGRFYQIYGSLLEDQHHRELFTSWMNRYYGFNNTYHDYIPMLIACDRTYKEYWGYDYKVSTTWNNKPVFAKYLTNGYLSDLRSPCKCAKLLQLWARWRSENTNITFKQYLANTVGLTIPYEPKTQSDLDALLTRCSFGQDTLLATCSIPSCTCVVINNNTQTETRTPIDCLDPNSICPVSDPPLGETARVDINYYTYVNYCVLNNMLGKKAKECPQGSASVAPCELIGNEVDTMDYRTAGEVEAYLEDTYEHDFTVIDRPILESDEFDSLGLRIICNEPTQIAQDYFNIFSSFLTAKQLKPGENTDLLTSAVYKTSGLAQKEEDRECTGCFMSDVALYKSAYIYTQLPQASYATGTLRAGWDIVLQGDTNTGCKVHFNNTPSGSLDSLVKFFHLKPLNARLYDGTQAFSVKALKIKPGSTPTNMQYETIELTGVAGPCLPIAECCPPRGLNLCNEPFYPEMTQVEVSCAEQKYAVALAEAENAYNDYIASVRTNMYKTLFSWANAAMDDEEFRMRYGVRQHHYTLYYYDQAGNLVQTVPPAGVAFLSATDVTAVQAMWKPISPTTWVITEPAHTKVTQYQYNSLNQLIWQKTPDGGVSQFWYDELGRLILSQNAQQNVVGTYSYTFYDELGRTNEVGEVQIGSGLIPSIGLPYIYSNFESTVLLYSRSQITRTTYDAPVIGMGSGSPLSVGTGNGRFEQTYMRNRVSATYTLLSPSSDPRHATFYSYDLHGNVKNLLQYNQSLADMGHEYKQIDYQYDLISGKVNQVAYQWNQADALYHRYVYDADNRLTGVWTSRDSSLWDQDAGYQYYLHGPLARTELMPNYKLQGIDYYYTIQGWLRGVNSVSLQANQDPGHDGIVTTQTSANSRPTWAKDVFGFELSYFRSDGTNPQDYTPIGLTSQAVDAPYAEQPSTSRLALQAPNLYNGNIRAMVSANSIFMAATNAIPLAFAFNYDQLNRLKSADMVENYDRNTNAWGAGVTSPYYHNRFSYDADGNIQSQVRRGGLPAISGITNGGGAPMDSLSYAYSSGINRLRHVTEGVSVGAYSYDIDGQNNDNYTYDAIGNLTKDVQAKISDIKWSVYGKITDITFDANSGKSDLAFEYGPDGQRCLKIVKPKDNNYPWTYTYYVRDAQGNVMATYTRITTKKIQYDQITFSDLNNKMIADKGKTDWINFAKQGVIATSAFKNAYLDKVITTSLGASYLENFGWTNYLNTHSTEIETVWDNGYTTTQQYVLMKDYRNRSVFTTDMLTQNCGEVMKSVMTNYATEFWAQANTSASSLVTAYTNAQPIAPLTDAEWLCANASISVLKDIIDAGLSNTQYDNMIGGMNQTTLRTMMDNYYGTAQKRAAMDVTANHTLFRDQIWALYSASVWHLYFTSTTSSSYYDVLLNYYTAQAGETQATGNYYTKAQYLAWTAGLNAWGSTYYNQLLTYYLTQSQHFTEELNLEELMLYGSARLGSIAPNLNMRKLDFDGSYSYVTGDYTNVTNKVDSIFAVNYYYKTLTRSQKRYELTNHLGNVLAVINDQWKTVCTGTTYTRVDATVIQVSDYSAFGAPLPGRTWNAVIVNAVKYKYGFNGEEKDDETYGNGNEYDLGERFYDPRLGRMLSLDPLMQQYPWQSPFAYCGNSPISSVDVNGAGNGNGNGTDPLTYSLMAKATFSLTKGGNFNGANASVGFSFSVNYAVNSNIKLGSQIGGEVHFNTIGTLRNAPTQATATFSFQTMTSRTGTLAHSQYLETYNSFQPMGIVNDFKSSVNLGYNLSVMTLGMDGYHLQQNLTTGFKANRFSFMLDDDVVFGTDHAFGSGINLKYGGKNEFNIDLWNDVYNGPRFLKGVAGHSITGSRNVTFIKGTNRDGSPRLRTWRSVDQTGSDREMNNGRFSLLFSHPSFSSAGQQFSIGAQAQGPWCNALQSWGHFAGLGPSFLSPRQLMNGGGSINQGAINFGPMISTSPIIPLK
jgi:RHS repeat-associated protein